MYLHEREKLKIIIALHLLEIVVRYCIGSNDIEGASEELKVKLENNKKAKELLISMVSNELKKITNDKLSRRSSRVIQEMGVLQWVKDNYQKTQVAREFMIITKFFFELITIPQEDIRNKVVEMFDILLEYEHKQKYSTIKTNDTIKIIKLGENEFNKIVNRAEKQAQLFYDKMLEMI